MPIRVVRVRADASGGREVRVCDVLPRVCYKRAVEGLWKAGVSVHVETNAP